MTRASAPEDPTTDDAAGGSGDPKEGYLKDYVSGRELKATPEEVEAVQVFARQLVEDYGYPISHLRTRPQWHVRARPSDTSRKYGLDIAVFADEHHTDDNLTVVVECKKRTRRDGRKQLEDYLTFSNAQLGVWFNGQERLCLKKVILPRGGVAFEEIPNIPRFGQSLDEVGQLTRRDLVVPHNLKADFRAIRNHLAGNTVGATDDKALAGQLINLVFCKIFDEKFTDLDTMVDFRAGLDEPAEKVAERITKLFGRVRKKYSEVLNADDAITLDPESIKYVVSQLQSYCLMDSDRDVVADAFETFISYALKGESGQFFTPRNVVQLLVQLTNPTPEENVIDPACGSGGFLVETLRHMWAQLDATAAKHGWNERALGEEKSAVAAKKIHGIEKDDFLAKVTKAYMAIMGDGKGGVFCDDSLELPGNWKETTRRDVALGRFDVVLANPPFGKDIKVVGEDKLAQFELAYKWKRQDDGTYARQDKRLDAQNPQILFIERCLQLLKPGGRLGIIIPETYFHAPKVRHVLRFLARGNNITAVVDLPHNTFRPHCNAKCVAVVVVKGEKQQEDILMAVAEQMGHDHQGKPMFRWDATKNRVDLEQPWDDIEVIIDELRSPTADARHTFRVPAADVAKSDIYVPRYYWETAVDEIRAEAKDRDQELVSIRELIDAGVISHFDGHGSPPAENKGRGTVPYIRVKDIVNWELYKDPTSMVPDAVFTAMVKDAKRLHERDVCFVRRGSYRIGSVAMVGPHDLASILTREIVIMRVADATNKWGIDPYYLLYLLDTPTVARQIPNKVLIETTLPNIGDRWQELLLPIDKDPERRKDIAKRVREAMDKKWQAVEAVHQLRLELTGKDEDDAVEEPAA